MKTSFVACVGAALLLSAGCGGSVESGTRSSGAGRGGAGATGNAGGGGSAGDATGGGGGNVTGGSGGNVTGGSGGGTTRRVPAQHRAAAQTCDHERPAGDACPECVPPTGTCSVDADCTDGENGRCESFRGYMECTYDECFEDAHCKSGGPCGCESAFWSDANACLEGNCRTDADCGNGGYCSPTFSDCGNYSGVVGYYCHTDSDECIDDSDCAGGDEVSGGYCMYSPQVLHWICSYSHCVG